MPNAWPGTLPTSFDVGYSEEPMMNVVVSEPDAGARLVRKRFTATPKRIRGTMLLTSAQKVILLDFFEQQQALRWSWANAIVGGATRYYDFASAPKFSAVAWDSYRVELELWEFKTELGGS